MGESRTKSRRTMKLPLFLQLCPVPILRGPARGKWWTLYPLSNYWRRGGQEPEMDLAIKMAGDLRGKVAWDCGAHFGIYTLTFSCLVGPSGQSVAFEPDPVSFTRLQRHMRLNRVKNVVAVEAAASDKIGESFMVLDKGAGATTSHLLYWGERVGDQTTTQRIECVRADDLTASGRVRDPDFIKLDVEGHGGHALSGAAESVARSRPFIIASMHSPQEIEGIGAVLEPLGYSVERFTGNRLQKCDWGDCRCGCNYVLRC
jgi:FkbM family methyltransferase